VRLFTLRGPVLRMPWPLVIAGWTGVRLWGLLRWLAAHGVGTLTILGLWGLWWLVRHGAGLWLAMAAGVVLLTMGVAMEAQWTWWRKTVAAVASFRRLRAYERQWDTAMVGAGLTRGDDLPTLMAHRFGGVLGERDLDVLHVKMLPGQLVSDWRAQSVRLAAALGLQRLRCHAVPGVPGDVQLYGRRFGLSPAARRNWQERAVLHPTVQPTVQLQAVPEEEAEEESTAVDEPVEELRRGAFPRQPRGDR